MGDSIIFSLNTTIPLFLMIVLGFFLKKIHILDDGFLKAANKFNFKLTLPVLLFVDMSSIDFRETFDLKFLLFCAAATSIAFWGVWGLAKLFIKDKKVIGEFVQASYRSSAAVMGLALISNIYGSTGMSGMMMLGAVPLYNIYAVIVLQSESEQMKEAGNERLKKALKGIVTNPIIIAILLGFLVSFLGINDFPKILDTGLNYVSRMATPLALICIGAEFDFKNAFSKIRHSAWAAVIKIIILPLIFIPIAILMGFRGEKLIAIFVMLAAPTTPSAFIMAKQYGYDGIVTSSTIVLTEVFSAVTLTLIVFVLKNWNFI
ncbi:MAG: AEC family transporter [Parasporobacterium sp.]|nr:AEC family transporter [Parasporobacterium sp.]